MPETIYQWATQFAKYSLYRNPDGSYAVVMSHDQPNPWLGRIDTACEMYAVLCGWADTHCPQEALDALWPHALTELRNSNSGWRHYAV